MSPAECVRGSFELTRPEDAIAVGVLTPIGAFVAEGIGILTNSTSLSTAVAITVLATAAGMAINDYFDRDIDRINKPGRPIPRGAVATKSTLSFSLVLFITTGALALLLPLVATSDCGFESDCTHRPDIEAEAGLNRPLRRS